METLEELAGVDLGKDGGFVGNADGYCGEIGGGGLRKEAGVVPGELTILDRGEAGQDDEVVYKVGRDGGGGGEKGGAFEDSEKALHRSGYSSRVCAGRRAGIRA